MSSHASNCSSLILIYFSRRLNFHSDPTGIAAGLNRFFMNFDSGVYLTSSLVSRLIFSKLQPVFVLASFPTILAITATSLLGLVSSER